LLRTSSTKLDIKISVKVYKHRTDSCFRKIDLAKEYRRERERKKEIMKTNSEVINYTII
jgi:hypothetical protein